MARPRKFGPELPPAMRKARRNAADRARRAAKRAPASKSATVALIKSVVARSEETKYRREIVANAVAHNSGIANADICRLLPKLVQDQGNGTTFERMGMKVSVRKLRISCHASLTDVNRSSAIVVKYWVLTHKDVKFIPNLVAPAVDMSVLLKTGDSNETQAFNGYSYEALLPVNNAKFTVLKTGSFLLGKNTGTVQDSTTASNQPMYGNHISKQFSFDLKCPKVLTYEQDTNSPRVVYYPAGYAPFIVFGYYHQNQTVPDQANLDLTVSTTTQMWYDDA